MDGEYNTSFPAFNPTPARMTVVEFSRPLYGDTNMIVTKFPDSKTVSPGAIFGFRLDSSVLIILAFVIIGCLGASYDSKKDGVHTVKQ